MKIISMAGGFTREELMTYKFVIYGNCITQMKVIVHAAAKLGVSMSTEENAVSPRPAPTPRGSPFTLLSRTFTVLSLLSQERADRLAKLPAGGDSFTSEVAEDISALWADRGIQAVYERRDKDYQLNDSAS